MKRNEDFNISLTRPVQGDSGIDMLLYYRDMLIIIQCKNLSKSVSVGSVREFITVFNSNETKKKFGIMVSSNGYSSNCYNLIKNHNILLLTDSDNISKHIIDLYKKFEQVEGNESIIMNRISLNINISIGYLIVIIFIFLIFIK